MPTEQSHIDAMRNFCTELESEGLVKSAHVDDWGRYSNFTVHIVPLSHDRTTTTRLKALVGKRLPKEAHLRECFGPDPVREYDSYLQTTKLRGYSRRFWVFDVDYQTYHPTSNSFS